MLASKDQIKADRLRMNNPYAAYHNLDDDSGSVALPLPPILTFSQLTKAGNGGIKVAEIEALVEQLKQAIWQQKHLLWPQGIPSDPVEIVANRTTKTTVLSLVI